MSNHLYYGDNLAVLRDSIADESVDLIYLDPPFNSNASYNVLFKGPSGNDSAAQIEAFDDTWHWNDSAEAAAAGLYEMEGCEPVPRIQIVTIEEALKLRDRAVRLPLRRGDTFKKAAREEDTRRQGALDL